jgi:hypothetical protein
MESAHSIRELSRVAVPGQRQAVPGGDDGLAVGLDQGELKLAEGFVQLVPVTVSYLIRQHELGP